MKNKLHGEIKTISLIFMLSSASTGLFANNLNISGISVDQTASTVSFTITWDNSWRNAGSPAGNDAAWVFVKYRLCTDNETVQFTHATLNTTVSTHTITINGGSYANMEPILRDGSATGIDANNTGIMLRPAAIGNGTISSNVILKLATALPAAGTLIDLRVYGIEMVFIPEGNYFLGDGDGANGSYNSLSSTGTTSYNAGHTRYTVTSEGAIPVNTLYYWNGSNQSYTLLAGFPKGWSAFHIMKYEISQGQYADFLNGITAGARTIHAYIGGANRNTITCGGVYPNTCSAAANKGDRACNFLSWYDLLAYLDWACLRPVNELMYEKAARGFTATVMYECAWGNTTITNATAGDISILPEDGTEIINGAPERNVCANNITFISGDNGAGPLRVGIFAEAGDLTRAETGAGYFGVMDLSGNLFENMVSVNAGTVAGGIAATLGNGALTVAGYADVADWSTGTTSYETLRGGAWDTNTLTSTGASGERLQISNRAYWAGWNATNTQSSVVGGRGAR